LCEQAPEELRALITAVKYNRVLQNADRRGHLSVVRYMCEQAPQRALITADGYNPRVLHSVAWKWLSAGCSKFARAGS